LKYEQRFGNCDIQTKFDRSLAEWAQRQRREYREGYKSMTKQRIDRLEKVPGWHWGYVRVHSSKSTIQEGLQVEFTQHSREEESEEEPLGKTKPEVPSAGLDKSQIECEMSRDVTSIPLQIDRRNYDESKDSNATCQVEVLECSKNAASSSSDEEAYSV